MGRLIYQCYKGLFKFGEPLLIVEQSDDSQGLSSLLD